MFIGKLYENKRRLQGQNVTSRIFYFLQDNCFEIEIVIKITIFLFAFRTEYISFGPVRNFENIILRNSRAEIV